MSVFVFVKHLDAALGEAALEHDRDIVVFVRQQMIEHFDDRHFGADRVVEVGELAADRARADDGQPLRLLRQRHRLAAR